MPLLAILAGVLISIASDLYPFAAWVIAMAISFYSASNPSVSVIKSIFTPPLPTSPFLKPTFP